jgi:prophage regulatory protein
MDDLHQHRAAAHPAQSPSPARIQTTPEQEAKIRRGERLLRIAEVEARLGLKKSSIYAYAATEPLLRPIRLTARSVAWPESRIDAYIQKLIDQAEQQAAL